MKPTTRNEYVLSASKVPAGTMSSRGFFEVPTKSASGISPLSSCQIKDILVFSRLVVTQVNDGNAASAVRRSAELCVADVTGFCPKILIVGAGAPSLVMVTLFECAWFKKLVAVKVMVNTEPGFMASEGIVTLNPLAAARTSVTFATEPPLTDTTLQTKVMLRPPDPDELAPFSARSSQRPTRVDEADRTTLGTVGTSGWPTKNVSFMVLSDAPSLLDMSTSSLSAMKSPGSTLAPVLKVTLATVDEVKLHEWPTPNKVVASVELISRIWVQGNEPLKELRSTSLSNTMLMLLRRFAKRAVDTLGGSVSS